MNSLHFNKCIIALKRSISIDYSLKFLDGLQNLGSSKYSIGRKTVQEFPKLKRTNFVAVKQLIN